MIKKLLSRLGTILSEFFGSTTTIEHSDHVAMMSNGEMVYEGPLADAPQVVKDHLKESQEHFARMDEYFDQQFAGFRRWRKR